MTIGWMGKYIEYGALFALLTVMVCPFWPAGAAEPERPEWVRFGTCTAPGDAACAGWPEDEESTRSVKDERDTFIYSVVYQTETGSAFGYFRKIASGRLDFSIVTGNVTGGDEGNPAYRCPDFQPLVCRHGVLSCMSLI